MQGNTYGYGTQAEQKKNRTPTFIFPSPKFEQTTYSEGGNTCFMLTVGEFIMCHLFHTNTAIHLIELALWAKTPTQSSPPKGQLESMTHSTMAHKDSASLAIVSDITRNSGESDDEQRGHFSNHIPIGEEESFALDG